MKKKFLYLMLVAGAIILSTEFSQAQGRGGRNNNNGKKVVVVKKGGPRVVRKRPVRPRGAVMTKPRGRRTPPGQVWVDGSWRFSNKRNRYAWVDGHFEKKRRGSRYRPGRWVNDGGGERYESGVWVRIGG